jgi:DNA-binding transcriptional regulator YdaS (Cro superfamily)
MQPVMEKDWQKQMMQYLRENVAKIDPTALAIAIATSTERALAEELPLEAAKRSKTIQDKHRKRKKNDKMKPWQQLKP